jgi:nascent polypeptide-associated complex subunit alpha
MPSVKEELEALKRQSLTKSHASKLQDANGLSTPEQEALKDTKNKTHLKTYKKEAEEKLKAGSKAVDQDLDFKVQQSAQKKQDLEKKKEAAQNLQNFKQKFDGSAKVAPAVTTVEASEPSTASTPPSIEEIPDIEDVPDLESVEPETVTMSAGTPDLSYGDAAAAIAQRVPNRAEKKARKVMERLGMKPVSGIARVTLKMSNQGFFTIYQPDVFEKNGSYIVFGEAKQGAGMPGTQQQQVKAAQQLPTPLMEEKKVDSVAEETEEEVDETGLDAKDIALVVTQAGCSRARAVAALKNNDGDLVNAIMSLTN